MTAIRWMQRMHGPFQAHVARLNGCALTILGGEDWWMWIVRNRHGIRVEGKTDALTTAKSAAMAAALPFLLWLLDRRLWPHNPGRSQNGIGRQPS